MLSSSERSIFVIAMILSMALFCRTDKCKAASHEVWLDSMETSKAYSEYYRTRGNRSAGENHLRIAGKQYEHGIGTHAPGQFCIDLDGKPRIVNGIVDMGAFEAPWIEPVDLVVDLSDDLADLNLQTGIENSLGRILDVTRKVLEGTNTNNDLAAIRGLQAFIRTVEAGRGKKIPEEDADALIVAAQEIIDVLSAE